MSKINTRALCHFQMLGLALSVVFVFPEHHVLCCRYVPARQLLARQGLILMPNPVRPAGNSAPFSWRAGESPADGHESDDGEPPDLEPLDPESNMQMPASTNPKMQEGSEPPSMCLGRGEPPRKPLNARAKPSPATKRRHAMTGEGSGEVPMPQRTVPLGPIGPFITQNDMFLMHDLMRNTKPGPA